MPVRPAAGGTWKHTARELLPSSEQTSTASTVRRATLMAPCGTSLLLTYGRQSRNLSDTLWLAGIGSAVLKPERPIISDRPFQFPRELPLLSFLCGEKQPHHICISTLHHRKLLFLTSEQTDATVLRVLTKSCLLTGQIFTSCITQTSRCCQSTLSRS